MDRKPVTIQGIGEHDPGGRDLTSRKFVEVEQQPSDFPDWEYHVCYLCLSEGVPPVGLLLTDTGGASFGNSI